MKLVVSQDGRESVLNLERDGSRTHVQLDDESIDLDVHALGTSTRSILWKGRQYDISVKSLGDDRFEVSGSFGSQVVHVMEPLAHLAATAHQSQAASASERVDAYMPGRVVDILVNVGDAVPAGHGIMVLEAMKMENEIQSERAGTIRQIFVAEGAAVEAGDALYEIE